MTHFVEALRYKAEGFGFDSRLCNWNFWLTQSFRPHYGCWIDSTCNRNEYQKYFRGGGTGQGLGLTTIPLSCADCLEIWVTQPPGTQQACNRLVKGRIFFTVSTENENVNMLWQQTWHVRGYTCLKKLCNRWGRFLLSWNFAVVHKFKIYYYSHLYFYF